MRRVDVFGTPYNPDVPVWAMPPLGWRALRYRVMHCWRGEHWWQFSELRRDMQDEAAVRVCAVCLHTELDNG